MNRPRLIRGLRIAWSVWWGILCVLLMVLWVRSHSRFDRVFKILPDARIYSIDSEEGGVRFNITYFRAASLESSWGFSSRMLALPEAAIFDSMWGSTWHSMSVPHLLVVLVSVTLTALPWMRRAFSLRTLLLATTLIAVVLGLVVWSSS
jgi:hypothetical protein